MIVKDNIIKKEDADYIESIFSGFYFPYFINQIVPPENTKDYQMTHIFYDNNKVTSDFFNMLKPILDYIKPKALVRIKANLNHQQDNINIHGFHKDFDYKNLKTAVYYVNTNNGFTIFKIMKKKSLVKRIRF